MAKVTELVARLAGPAVEAAGCELWDVEYVREAGSWYLRLYIDKEGGVTIDDCERFSRAIDKRLDAADPIDQSYTLEVSSPGIERELTKDWHYEACMGLELSVRLIRPVDGARDFVGTLTGCGEDGVTILLPEDVEMTFQRGEASHVRLYNDYTMEDFGTDDDEGE